ncbi:MAG: Crp/Fnr family transcriptional regulator [Methyloceanibacter sp.]|uniref:Crp/Fnr family transcriptional regulator n=1 Tax=Methyloceanibacter sp. TaxID=1965321 RepID=UPI003EDEBF5E
MGFIRIPAEQLDGGLPFPAEAALPRNALLRSLPADEFARLSPLLERVPLVPRRVLQHAGLPIEHLFFIEEGLVSVLAKVDERNAAEVWLIGRDGVVGGTVVLGGETSDLTHFVQIGGSALRLSVEDLNRLAPELPCLAQALKGYLHVSLMQSSQSAACSLRHALLPRLARWLLMAHDRSDLDRLSVTQDLLARSLGVRRPTVSCAFKDLEQRGIFAKDRGVIRIKDRPSLERIACRCYRIMRAQRDKWEMSKAKRKVLIALSAFCAAAEAELLAG